MWGLTVEEAQETVEVWPCCVPAVNVMVAMSTQWNIGMSGPTGLKYESLPFVMKTAGVAAKDRADVFDDLRIMEDVALETMRNAK